MSNFGDKKLTEEEEKSCPERNIAQLNKRNVDDGDEDFVCDRIEERSKWRRSMASCQNSIKVIRKSKEGKEKESHDIGSHSSIEKHTRNGEADDSQNGQLVCGDSHILLLMRLKRLLPSCCTRELKGNYFQSVER